MIAPRKIVIQEVVRSATLVAVFDVPATIAPEMPDDPLIDAQTARLLDEAMLRVDAGDREWLRAHGAKLFVSLDEANTAMSDRVA